MPDQLFTAKSGGSGMKSAVLFGYADSCKSPCRRRCVYRGPGSQFGQRSGRVRGPRWLSFHKTTASCRQNSRLPEAAGQERFAFDTIASPDPLIVQAIIISFGLVASVGVSAREHESLSDL